MFVHNIYSSWESYTSISTVELFCSPVSKMKSYPYWYAVAAAVIAVGILVFSWIGFVASSFVAACCFVSASFFARPLAVLFLPLLLPVVLLGCFVVLL